jgi:glucose/arabinose dehydrogenase
MIGRLLVLLAAASPVALAACGSGDEPERVDPGPRDGARVETIATGLVVPWELAFLPDGSALLTERGGNVRRLTRDGRLEPDPVARLAVAAEGEGGLLGLAVDPSFRDNSFVYLYRTTAGGNEVLRLRLEGDRLGEPRVLARGIPAAVIHNGGRLRFGPDRFLYITTGDATDPNTPQDPDSLGGKVLRLAPTQYGGAGGRPEVFSLGHRNPQGLDWEPRTGRLVSDEHGPDGDDELDILGAGGNYGWPEARADVTTPGMTAPVAFWPDSIAPSGATFVREPGSEWAGDYLIGSLVGEQVRRVRLRGDRAVIDEPLFEGEFGRIRTVVEGPDGALYLLTSNRDGRAQPCDADDRILRVTAPPS